MTLLPIGHVLEKESKDIRCQIPSIFEGKDVTNVKVRVGGEYLDSGSITETLDSHSKTYTVNYTQSAVFSYAMHQGQSVHCELVWMIGTTVETNLSSKQQTLEIFCKFLKSYFGILIYHSIL